MKILELEPVKFVRREARELVELFIKLEGDKVYPPRFVKTEVGIGYLVNHKDYDYKYGKTLQRGTLFTIEEEGTMIYRVKTVVGKYVETNMKGLQQFRMYNE